MNVAILGYGTIGSGVDAILSDSERLCQGLSVSKILDLPRNQYKSEKIVCDIQEILNDASIDCVVETIGGIHPAYDYIIQALSHSKHVVTANKAVVAKHFQEFVQLAVENHVSFRFEASVAGGIPWIASIVKASRIDEINDIYGILNGTTNFILDRMNQYHNTFAQALTHAQQLGYAEADPSADVDGYDIRNKIAISASLALHAPIHVQDIPCFSIRNINLSDFRYVDQTEKTIKYIGRVHQENDKFYAYVIPHIIPKTSLEANTASNFNIATLYGKTIGTLKFYGQGAGKYPTANAIVQDLLDIQNKTPQNNLTFDNSYAFDTTYTSTYLIRTTQTITLEHIEKHDIFESYHYYQTSPIDFICLQKIMDVCYQKDSNAFVATYQPLL